MKEGRRAQELPAAPAASVPARLAAAKSAAVRRATILSSAQGHASDEHAHEERRANDTISLQTSAQLQLPGRLSDSLPLPETVHVHLCLEILRK